MAVWPKAYLSFEFDGEEYEEEVEIHGRAVTYNYIKDEIIKQIEEWKDTLEDALKDGDIDITDWDDEL